MSQPFVYIILVMLNKKGHVDGVCVPFPYMVFEAGQRKISYYIFLPHASSVENSHNFVNKRDKLRAKQTRKGISP